MVRSIAPIRRSGTDEPDNAADDERAGQGAPGRSGSSGGRLRKALLGLGLLGAAAVVARRVRSGGAPSADAVRETVDGAVPESVDDAVPEGVRDVVSGSGGSDADESVAAEAGTEPVDTESGTPTDEPLPDEAHSPEELEERVAEDTADEPAPGETTGDEERA